MITSQHQQLSWLSSSKIQIAHATLTSNHGVSITPYQSLNLGFNVKDDPKKVDINRQSVKTQFQITNLISANQTHSPHAALIENAASDLILENVDAFITQQTHTALMVQHADCQAVLLYDPKTQAIAAIHNGWRGSVQNIIKATVSSLIHNFNSAPKDLIAYISPSLGPCCAEFKNYKTELPPEFYQWKSEDDYFNFWQISAQQLQECGVNSHNIDIAQICTVCDSNYFSYRRAVKSEINQGLTGRNGTFIMLTKTH